MPQDVGWMALCCAVQGLRRSVLLVPAQAAVHARAWSLCVSSGMKSKVVVRSALCNAAQTESMLLSQRLDSMHTGTAINSSLSQCNK